MGGVPVAFDCLSNRKGSRWVDDGVEDKGTRKPKAQDKMGRDGERGDARLGGAALKKMRAGHVSICMYGLMGWVCIVAAWEERDAQKDSLGVRETWIDRDRSIGHGRAIGVRASCRVWCAFSRQLGEGWHQWPRRGQRGTRRGRGVEFAISTGKAVWCEK